MGNVRIIGYRSLSQLAQGNLKHHNAESVFVREEPPMWRQKLTSNGAVPVTSAVQSPDGANLVVVEVDPGFAIRYEIQPNGPNANTARAPDTLSPSLTGINVFQWFQGGTFSIVDASAV